MLPVKVLIVEDDNAMAQMCAKLIRRRGHSAVIASSCRDAVAIIAKGHDIDLVLTDIQMPQMMGDELLRQVRTLDEALPVIVMTGYPHLISPAQLEALGAADYLLKPFDSETLLASVEKAVRSRPNLTHN